MRHYYFKVVHPKQFPKRITLIEEEHDIQSPSTDFALTILETLDSWFAGAKVFYVGEEEK